ncbi:intraflagellar transport protein 25 homolog [Rhinoraja longicauda]
MKDPFCSFFKLYFSPVFLQQPPLAVGYRPVKLSDRSGLELPELCTRNTETFWITTGMFPQEFILRFPELIKISCVKIHCYNVCRLSIEKSTEKDPVDFEPLAKSELERSEEQLQLEEFTLDGTRATHLRFVIKSGFDHFVSVHKVTIEGTEELT